MNTLNQELVGIENISQNLENEKVRITSNKGVTIRASNTYYIMPNKYGYRLTIINNIKGLEKESDGLYLEKSIRGFDGAVVFRVKDINCVLAIIKKSENILH